MEVSESNSDVFLNCTAKPGNGTNHGGKMLSLCNTWDGTQRFPSPVPWEGSGDLKGSIDDAFTRRSFSKSEQQKESGVRSDELMGSSAFKVRQFLHSFHYPGNALHTKKSLHLQRTSGVVNDEASMPSCRAQQQAAKLQSSSPGVMTEPSQRISRHHHTLSLSTIPPEPMESVSFGDIPQPPPHLPSGSDSSVMGLGGVFPPWNVSVAGTTYSLPCGVGSCRAQDHLSSGSIGGVSLGAAETATPSITQQSIGDTGKHRIPFSLISIGHPDSSLLERQPLSSTTRVEEELNLNPFTAAYRNFTESSLSNIYHTLSLMGEEIEMFAYSHMVENFYQTAEENTSATPAGVYRGADNGSYHESPPPLGGLPPSLLGVFYDDSTPFSTLRGDAGEPHDGYFSMALSLKKQAFRKRTGSGDMLLPFFVEERPSLASGEDLAHLSKNSTAPTFPDGQRTGSEKIPSPRSIVPPEEWRYSKEVPPLSSFDDGKNIPSELKPCSLGVPLTSRPALPSNPQYPLCADNNYFLYSDDWFEEFPLPYLQENAKIALSMEAPQFFCGMLLDPVSERYLFAGATFYEECRVLKVLIDPQSYLRDLQKDTQRRSVGGAEAFLFDATSSSSSSEKMIARILCREYISLKRAHHGFIVQTFSLIEPGVKVEGRRNQLVSATVVKTLFDRLRAGAITRAFGLQQVMTVKAVKTVARAAPLAAGPSEGAASSLLSNMDSFLPTLFFTRNILPRSIIASPQSFLHQQRNSALAVSMCRFRNDPTGNGEEESYFLSLDGSLRPTVDVKMQQHSSIYMKAIDNIKGYLIFFKDQFSIRTMIKVFFHSVRCLQHFFRYCIAKKQRAITRMIRLWRFLELDCRLKLHHYHPLPSSTERIDMIAANLLLPHMITPREYKQDIIEEMWKKRRKEYRTWEKERKVEEFLKTSGVSILSNQGFRTIPNPVSTAKGSTVPFSEVESALEKAIVRLREKEREESYSYSKTGCFVQDSYASELATEGRRRETLTEMIRKNRLKDEMHRQFGWYIEPEQLLYESHSRLLTSLKDSVLTMEEVRLEIQSLSLERAERGKSTESKQGNQSNRGISSS